MIPTSDRRTTDHDRLWSSLMEMAEIGATPAGGVCRLAGSDEDRIGRDLFVRWCEDAGLDVSVDQMGNLFARRPGRDPERLPVLTGSHLDSQPTGGRFDGVYGVLAALEVVRSLNDHGIETEAPVEIVSWTNEEGARFPPAMLGSSVFGGTFELAYGLDRTDRDGIKLGDELKRIGYAGDVPCGGRELGAYLEVHIEQGPILEAEQLPVGVVTGVQGIRWYEATLNGREAHAGTTPMDRRADALLGASRLVVEINRIARDHDPEGRSTVGILETRPGSTNTVPGEVSMSVDLRHPSAEVLAQMNDALSEAVTSIAEEVGLEASLDQIWYSPPIDFDPTCVDAVRRGAAAHGLGHRDIVSGAGHDACSVAGLTPTGMIFIPCLDGISHNEAESSTPEECAAGADVLFDAVIELAGEVTDA